MTDVQRAPEIRGKTISFQWTGGPTQGKTHVHDFHEDGTVEWRDAGTPKKADQGDNPAKERVEYAAVKVADGIYVVSYLAPSGFTLTVVLNFHDSRIVGFASGAKEWHPVQGTFEVAG
jgi:molybdenum cofactor biosynthesis protein MoaF